MQTAPEATKLARVYEASDVVADALGKQFGGLSRAEVYARALLLFKDAIDAIGADEQVFLSRVAPYDERWEAVIRVDKGLRLRILRGGGDHA